MSLDDIGGAPEHTHRPTAARGKVVRVTPLLVVLVNYGQPYDILDTNWLSATPPVAGQTCLVLFDDDGDAWVFG